MNHRLAAYALVLTVAFGPLASAASLGVAAGTITAVSGSALTLQTRTGAMMTVGPTKAQEGDLSVVLLVGETVMIPVETTIRLGFLALLAATITPGAASAQPCTIASYSDYLITGFLHG